jgi:hypothetical protein
MIISASRRTDLPAFYGAWFLERVRAGCCEVPNPFNPRQVSRVSLRPDDVDAFVFWTKDPAPFLGALDELDGRGFRYYFQFTLNPYGAPLEPRLPGLEARIGTFLRLAERLGPRRVLWRYDPIVVSEATPPGWHAEQFALLAERLRGATTRATISLMVPYRKTVRRTAGTERFAPRSPGAEEVATLVGELGKAAAREGISLRSCAGGLPGIEPGSCVDALLVRELWGVPASVKKDSGQRPECRCAASRDIGVNDTCVHGCLYCYATRSQALAERRLAEHESNDSMLYRVAPS